MTKKTQNLQQAVRQTQARLAQLNDKIASLKNEGRKDDWTRQRIKEETDQTKRELFPLKNEMKLHVWQQKAGAREKLKNENKDYAARQYYLELADKLAEGKNGEELVKVYEQACKDPELSPFKGEFERIIEGKINSDYKPQFEAIRSQNKTPEEAEGERELAEAEAMEKHSDMLQGMADMALEELESQGYTSIDLQQAYEEAVKNSQRQGSSDIKPEDRAENQEALRQTMAQTQSE